MSFDPSPLTSIPDIQEFSTVVDRTALVKGDFSSSESCAIRIDGRYTGHITLTNGVVVVSETGIAEDVDIEADVVVISGSFSGKAHAHTALHVSPSANVSGTLVSSAYLRIHSKATVRAHLVARPELEK